MDLARFPELRFLNRHDWLMPIALICACYALGALAPASWNTSGLQMVVWGFVISTVLLFHGTSTINSLAHLIGRRRFKTKDESRNNFRARADHDGRRLAQQPSPLPRFRASGVRLVGDRFDLLRTLG